MRDVTTPAERNKRDRITILVGAVAALAVLAAARLLAPRLGLRRRTRRSF